MEGRANRPTSGILERRASGAFAAARRPSEIETRSMRATATSSAGRDTASARARKYWSRLAARPPGHGPPALLTVALPSAPALLPVASRANVNASRMRFQAPPPTLQRSDSRTNGSFPCARVQLVVCELLERVAKRLDLNADPSTQRRALDALLLEDTSQNERAVRGVALSEHNKRHGGGGERSEREQLLLNRLSKERPYSTGHAVGIGSGSTARPNQQAVSMDSSSSRQRPGVRPISRSAGSSTRTTARALHELRRREANLYVEALEDDLIQSPTATFADTLDMLFGATRLRTPQLSASATSRHSPTAAAPSPALELQLETQMAADCQKGSVNAIAEADNDENRRQWCMELADLLKRAVRERVRLSGRFRLVCVLTVGDSTLGQRGQHSALVASRCLWDNATDRCVSVAVRCPRARAFILALLFALYTE